MRWQLSEEQEAYRQSLAGWLSEVASTEVVRGWLDAGDATTFAARFDRDGWSGVGIPESLGGQGGGLLELALTAEQLAAVSVPSAAWLAAVLAAPALGARAEPVALLVSSESIPGDGPRLTMDGEGRLHGVVPRVLGADLAASFVAVLERPHGLRLIPAGEGVRLVGRRLLDRSRSVADVVVDDASSEPLEPEASDFLAGCAARAAVLVAADALGAMSRMLELTVEYSLQRHQFGVPIGSFQAVKHAAATMLVEVEAARSAVYFAAASVDAGEPRSDLHAAAVKAQVTAAGSRVADSALTLHGAIGYTWEHDLQLFYKRAKLDEYLYGKPAGWNERIADRLQLLV